MKKILIAMMAVALLAFSCVNQQDVSVSGVKSVDMQLPTSVNLVLGVENRSAHKLQLLSCDMDVLYKGQKIGSIMVSEPVTVPRRFFGDVPVALKLRISDVIAGYSAVNNLQNGGNGVTVSGQALVKAGWGRKKIAIENESLSRLISTFAGGQ